jgi:hypothetical protein
VREECVGLIRAAWDLRTMTQNNHEYHGNEMGARLARVRERAADAAVRSTTIALLATGHIVGTAAGLASAAQQVAAAAAAGTNLDMGKSICAPDFTELDFCIKEFSEATADYFGG